MDSSRTSSISRPQRIVILGGGFGGTYTAYHLSRLWRGRKDVEIVLVSNHNYFLITPLLFEAGSGVLEPRDAVSPLRAVLRGVRFVHAQVERVDFDAKTVFASQEGETYELDYEQLVIALGGVTNLKVIPGSEHAATFKTLGDAIYLRNEIIEMFECADVERDPAIKQALLSFVIVGAGLVGVELMGELTIFTRHLAKSYPHVDAEHLRFTLIEAGPKILPELEGSLADYVVKVFKGRGVDVRVSSPVKQIEPGKVHLPIGEVLQAATIVLAAGVAPNPLLADMNIEKERKGRIAVDATMRTKQRPEVWALGDCAAIPDPSGKPYPQLAQHAIREARVLAENIVSALAGRPTQPFVYQTLGTLAALGHFKGVGRVMKMRFYGFVAWWIWRTYYLLQMPGWERRIRIVLDWTVALFFKNDIVKLDLFGDTHPSRGKHDHAADTEARTERIA